MIKKSSTFISGVLAFGIYFTLIGILLFYFNSREQKKPVHYVKKNEDRIQVSMGSTKPAPKKELKKQPKKVSKPKPKPKPKPKKTVAKKKVVEKKVVKEKVVKKAKVVKKKNDVNTTKPKKVNAPKDLFANVTSTKRIEKPKPKTETKPVETKKSNSIKVSEKTSASALVSDSLKNQKKSDSGIENAYLAMIEEKLREWPAQSEYAGEKARVWIKVEPSGRFIYRVVSASANEAFNSGLTAYLDQLMRIGFGPHKGNRPYELDVEFIAKE